MEEVTAAPTAKTRKKLSIRLCQDDLIIKKKVFFSTFICRNAEVLLSSCVVRLEIRLDRILLILSDLSESSGKC